MTLYPAEDVQPSIYTRLNINPQLTTVSISINVILQLLHLLGEFGPEELASGKKENFDQ